MAESIAIIGIGAMGAGAARRLLDQGRRVVVWNRTRSKVAPLLERGATAAESPREAAAGAEIVITFLADDRTLEEVVVGPDGVASGLRPDAVHLSMSTIAPTTARMLAEAQGERGAAYVAAPVFGRPPLAAQGQLDIVAAGPEEALRKCDALFKLLGKQTFVVGAEPAKANAVKIARNFLLATMIESLGEAFALVRKCGVEPQKFLDVIGGTSLSSPAYRNYGKMIVEQAWRPAQFAMPLGLKDVELALSTAREAGMRLPSGEMIRAHLLEAIADGRVEDDWAALAGHIAARAGL